MRLLEEKHSVLLQIISLVVITLSTISAQIANYKVDEYADELIHKRMKLNELSTQSFEYRRYSEKYGAVQVSPVKLEVVQDLLSDPNVNTGAKRIAEQYINGAISHDEMVKQFRNHYMGLHLELRKVINTLTHEFNEDKNKGSKWQAWRDYVFTPLQLIGVVILIIGNAQLLLSVSNRINKPGKKNP